MTLSQRVADGRLRTVRRHLSAIYNGPRSINLVIVCELIQQCKVDQVLDALLLPVAHPTPSRAA